MVKVRNDLTGKHIEGTTLTVIEQVEDYIKPSGKREARWLCQCDCGGEPFVAIGYNLKTGNTKSCLKCGQKKTAEAQRKTNIYDLSGKYGIGYAINTNNEFYFDLEDYDKIKDYCWYENVNKGGYHSLETRDWKNNNNLIRMCWLLGCKGYDHVDRNPLNNRRNNLRQATVVENNRNHRISKRNTSGVIGIGYYKAGNKWRAYISNVENKFISLGYYEDKDDAIRARLVAEKEIYKEFAPQKHLFEEYGVN